MPYGSEPASRLAGLYLAIGAGEPDDLPERRSVRRRAAVLLASLMVLTALPLHWAATARGDDLGTPVATAKESTSAQDDDDGDGSGDDSSDDSSDSSGATATSSGGSAATDATDSTGDDPSAPTFESSDQPSATTAGSFDQPSVASLTLTTDDDSAPSASSVDQPTTASAGSVPAGPVAPVPPDQPVLEPGALPPPFVVGGPPARGRGAASPRSSHTRKTKRSFRRMHRRARIRAAKQAAARPDR